MRLLFITMLSVVCLSAEITNAQTTNDLLNLLTQKGTISKTEADSIRFEYAAKQRSSEARQDSFPLSLGRILRLSGYTQARYQYYQQAGKYDEFDIRRARLDFQGDFSSKWGYRLLVDFVGSTGATGTAPTGGALVSPTLLDAFIAYKPFDFLKITAGQFLIPFSVENLTQDRNLETVDRSQVVSALVARKGDVSNGLVDSIGNQNGREMGIQLSGSLIKFQGRYLADYYIALLDGAGINTVDNNQSKDIDARLVLHPLKILDIGASYYNGFDRFTSSPAKNQERIRWGGEFALNYSLLSVKGEYIKGREGNSNPIVHEGWYLQGSYFFWPKHLQGVFRYDTYNPNVALSKTVETSTYYVFGLNYFFNVWTKLQVNYSRRTENANINNDVFTAQLQLAF
ncbi:MAG TPA: porin [Puia sp.]|jgi:phosphate-selective porin OprO/OprP|nr:porin [Puia sp.]